VHPRLRGLYDSGLITEPELHAAEQWGRWTERTDAPVTSSWQVKVDGGSPAHGDPRSAAIQAAKHCREIAAALGQARTALLHACVVRDEVWQTLGARLGCDVVRAKALVAEAVRALALLGEGRPVPPLPNPWLSLELGEW
jgi:hypothetical protein